MWGKYCGEILVFSLLTKSLVTIVKYLMKSLNHTQKSALWRWRAERYAAGRILWCQWCFACKNIITRRVMLMGLLLSRQIPCVADPKVKVHLGSPKHFKHYCMSGRVPWMNFIFNKSVFHIKMRIFFLILVEVGVSSGKMVATFKVIANAIFQERFS